MALHGLIGFDANPSQMQLICYLATAGLIGLAAQYAKNRARGHDAPRLAH